MMLVDWQIRNLCTLQGLPLLEPFSEAASGDGVISYGLSTHGYDLRLAPEIWSFNNSFGEAVDPLKFRDDDYRKRMFDVREIHGEFVIPAHGYVLGRSIEYLRMPQNIAALCVGKSTYSRCGVLINTTPAEAGWGGVLVIEIANTNPAPVVVRTMQGIAQMLFFRLDAVPDKDYNAKPGGGKYDGQTGVTVARVL